MSAHTQARKRHNFGRSFLHQSEAKIGMPWYMSQKWTERKAVIAKRIKSIEERAHIRRLEKQDKRMVSWNGNGQPSQQVKVEKSLLSRLIGGKTHLK